MRIKLIDKESQNIIRIFDNVIEINDNYLINLMGENLSTTYWKLDTEEFIELIGNEDTVDNSLTTDTDIIDIEIIEEGEENNGISTE